MKRRRAINLPGHVHELTFSCYRGLPLLSKDRSRRWLVEAIERCRQSHSVELYAYVIMPEHAHVLLKSNEADARIEDIQRSFKQSVSRRAMNWLREHDIAFLSKLAGERAGDRIRHHFWQPGGGYDRNIINPDTLRHAIDYIHANPVRRGLVERPIDWPWSSAGFYAGQSDASFLMDPLPL